MPNTHILVQLSISESKFIDMHKLISALKNDPDLRGVPEKIRPSVLQSLYVCTGCDYVSFFNGLGKASFLTAFFRNASFIGGGINPMGSIGNIEGERRKLSFFSFIRLVRCAYFRKNISAFKESSPESAFNSIDGFTSQETHALWLNKIREKTWLRADTESSILP